MRKVRTWVVGLAVLLGIAWLFSLESARNILLSTRSSSSSLDKKASNDQIPTVHNSNDKKESNDQIPTVYFSNERPNVNESFCPDDPACFDKVWPDIKESLCPDMVSQHKLDRCSLLLVSRSDWIETMECHCYIPYRLL